MLKEMNELKHCAQVSLYTLEENQTLCFKVETHVAVAAEQVFLLLSDLRRRKAWDHHYQYVKIILNNKKENIEFYKWQVFNSQLFLFLFQFNTVLFEFVFIKGS